MFNFLSNLKPGDVLYLNKNRRSHQIDVTFSPVKRKDHYVFRGVIDGECKDFVFTEGCGKFLDYSKLPKYETKRVKIPHV